MLPAQPGPHRGPIAKNVPRVIQITDAKRAAHYVLGDNMGVRIGMNVRRLVEGSSFASETLTVIFQAFDEAWASVAAQFTDDPLDARERLAHAVLLVAREDSRDPDQLKEEALRIFKLAAARNY